MSYPELPDEHTATRAIDELFRQHDVSREDHPESRYTDTEDDVEYTYHHYRCIAHHNGDNQIPEGAYETQHGVVFVEESGEDPDSNYVQVVVDTKAESKDEHPAAQ